MRNIVDILGFVEFTGFQWNSFKKDRLQVQFFPNYKNLSLFGTLVYEYPEETIVTHIDVHEVKFEDFQSKYWKEVWPNAFSLKDVIFIKLTETAIQGPAESLPGITYSGCYELVYDSSINSLYGVYVYYQGFSYVNMTESNNNFRFASFAFA